MMIITKTNGVMYYNTIDITRDATQSQQYWYSDAEMAVFEFTSFSVVSNDAPAFLFRCLKWLLSKEVQRHSPNSTQDSQREPVNNRLTVIPKLFHHSLPYSIDLFFHNSWPTFHNS